MCLIYPTCAEFFYTFFGALRLGAIPVPLYPTLGRRGHRRHLPRLRGHGGGHHRLVPPGRRGVRRPRPRTSATCSSRATSRSTTRRPPFPTASADDVAFLQYTSGSTGTAARRGAEPRQRGAHGGVHGRGRAAHPRRRGGLVAAALPRHGADRLRVHPAVERGAAPPAAARPQEPARLARAGHPGRAPPSRCRPTSATATACGTSATPPASISPRSSRRSPARSRCASAPSRRSSRSSAWRTSSPRATASPRPPSRWRSGRARPRSGSTASGKFLSVGQPCRGRARADHGRRGARSRPGAEGEICVQSPGVMQGYYNNPEATAQVLSPDGWLRTGDLGFLDAEGYLYVTGRLKDVIILGGENVIPADVEEIVDQVPGVRYSAAVGIESERTGTQRLHVVAEVREPAADAETLSRLVREIVQRVREGRGHRPGDACCSSAPAPSPRPRPGKIQRSRLGRDDHARRARRSSPPRLRRRPSRLVSCPPPRRFAHEDRLPPAHVRAGRHARERAHLRPAHGGARLRLALGQRPRGDPVPDRSAVPLQPDRPVPARGRRAVPRAAGHPVPGGGRHRARAARHQHPGAAPPQPGDGGQDVRDPGPPRRRPARARGRRGLDARGDRAAGRQLRPARARGATRRSR